MFFVSPAHFCWSEAPVKFSFSPPRMCPPNPTMAPPCRFSPCISFYCPGSPGGPPVFVSETLGKRRTLFFAGKPPSGEKSPALFPDSLGTRRKGPRPDAQPLWPPHRGGAADCRCWLKITWLAPPNRCFFFFTFPLIFSNRRASPNSTPNPLVKLGPRPCPSNL